jgi:hypothetical protein
VTGQLVRGIEVLRELGGTLLLLLDSNSEIWFDFQAELASATSLCLMRQFTSEVCAVIMRSIMGDDSSEICRIQKQGDRPGQIRDRSVTLKR